MLRLLGPFKQAVTMQNLPDKGGLSDDRIVIIEHAGILIQDHVIEAVDSFRDLKSLVPKVEQVEGDFVVMPGLIDVHTHLCWAGSRARDYAMRLSGRSYLEIAADNGGIWSTVSATRDAEPGVLVMNILQRADKLLSQGITTIEVKSGYGLDTVAELKIMEAIQKAAATSDSDLVPTCLAAHIKPQDFRGTAREYLETVLHDLLPVIKSRGLSNRVDIYIDKGAFGTDDARFYLMEAKKMGFDVVIHADQFSTGGANLAVEMGAKSADHLEAITASDIKIIAGSPVVPVALPGASMGLGMEFTPARKILDAGASLAIASDWNPGTAPMGNLLLQAAVLGMYEKLTMTETLAAITCRAAKALGLNDRGILEPGCLADFIAFPTRDYREILYSQGSMMPGMVWKSGKRV